MGSTRLAQTLIMQGLDASDAAIQALLLELIVTKELRISNVKYNVPKPFFLVIAVLPQGYDRLGISSQLVRRPPPPLPATPLFHATHMRV